MSSLVTVYNGLLTAVNTFFLVYRLNEDNANSLSKYVIPTLAWGIFSAYLIVLFPELHNGFRVILNLVALVLIIWILLKHNIFKALASGILSVLIMGFGDAIVAVIYVFPFKIVLEDYLNSPFHITAGQLIIFMVSFSIISILGERIKSVINNALRNHHELMIILSVNLLAVGLLLGLSLNFLHIYLTQDNRGSGREYIIVNMFFIMVALLVIFGATLYLINRLIVKKLKLEKNINIYNFDDLTGAFNRGAGLNFLREQLKICKQKNLHITICYIDIDNLKGINDKYGHRKGDKVIVSVVNLIKENIRNSDRIMRIGGDEFVIIFPNCSADQAEIIVDRIKERLKEVKWEADDEHVVSFSYGFAQCGEGESIETVDSLLDRADLQMYKYKKLHAGIPNV